MFEFILGLLPLSEMGGNRCKFECVSSDLPVRFSVSFEDVLLMGTCSEILAAVASFGKLLFSPSLLKNKISPNQLVLVI